MNTVDYEKLTIYEVESFHKILLQWCGEAQKVLSLDFGRVQKIDIAAIQLLLSAQKTCHKKSSELILENVSSSVRETLRLAGCEMLFKGLK